MDQQQMNFEEAEKILSWRETQIGGIYIFVEKETVGVNKWMKPITVVTLKQHAEGPPIKFYAPRKRVKAYATMPIGIMGSKSLALLD